MKAGFVIAFLALLFFSCVANDKRSEINYSSKPLEESLDSIVKPGLIDLMDSTTFNVIELKSLNSHHFSRETVKAERDRVFDLALSKMYHNWKNPTSGGAVHINEKDEIVVYNAALPMDSANARTKIVGANEVWYYVQGFTFGNAPCVLITCELDVRKSVALPAVIDEVFKTFCRVFILESK